MTPRSPIHVVLPGEEPPADGFDLELPDAPVRPPPSAQPSRRVTPRSDPAPVSSQRGARRPRPTDALLPGWTDDMRVGNGRIDRQHKTFFLRAVRIAIACEEGRGDEELDEALRHLHEFADEHFRDEEELMALVSFPYLESHREAHHAFRLALAEFEGRLAATRDRTAIAMELAAWVADWFKEHVTSADRLLARYLDGSIG